MSNVINFPEPKEQEGGNNKIVMFFHCALCLEELPKGMTPREYQVNECGWTEKGFQVWCCRHDANVINMDFEGQRYTAI